MVDPELLPLLELLPVLELTQETLPVLRKGREPLPEVAGVAEAVRTERRGIPGPSGAPDVEVLIHWPTNIAEKSPCILHIHGGGYVMGSAMFFAPIARAIVMEIGCPIVSVDYRLAPETIFPGAIEDCYAALGWLFRSAEQLGLDATRIGVMGESAGGGLAAALALLSRDRGEHRLAFQHLIYPMLDDRTCVHPDPHPHAGHFVWTPAANQFGWTCLLGGSPGAANVSPYAAAARANDLSNLPPTYLSTGALDLFVEENLDYARRLTRAAVPVELHVYPSAFHAFDFLSNAAVSSAARHESIRALRRFTFMEDSRRWREV